MERKILNILITITALFMCVICPIKIMDVHADSGWDNDYDSGSSWDSGSDWGSDSSSSWDYDSGSSHSSGGCKTEQCRRTNNIIFGISMFVIFTSITIALIIENVKQRIKRKKRNKEIENIRLNEITDILNRFDECDNDTVNKVIPDFDIESFKSKAYQIFYDIQIGWMEFDYDKLKEILSDELYNSYVMDLEALKLKKYKNVMCNFNLKTVKLNELKKQNGKYIATVIINVSFNDYIVNEKSKIVRGNPKRIYNNVYKLTFERTVKEKVINVCPQCGAKVEGNITGICEYCKSKLVNNNYGWVLVKKEKLNYK